jgi:hypothetical protein
MPLVFRIDVEPDERYVDRSHPLPWHGFERAFEILRSIRQRIKAATGTPAHFVWLLRMDPQVAETHGAPQWAAERYALQLRLLAEVGDEIGLHTHAFRWLEERRRWGIDHGDQAWVEHCVDMSLTAYHGAFGRRCTVFSFGDRWMNDATVRMLEAQGVQFDLTIEPDQPATPSVYRGDTGTLPDCANVPRHPYRPSPEDFRVADPSRGQGIWMMPMASEAFPRPLVRRLYRAMLGKSAGRHVQVTLSPRLDPDVFRSIVERTLLRQETAVLCMVVRSDAFVRRRQMANICANLDWFLARPDINRFSFTTPERALSMLSAHPGTLSREPLES